MAIAFLVSSLGDTDQATETIKSFVEHKTDQTLYLVPLTETAAARTKATSDPNILRITLTDITHQNSYPIAKVSDKELKQLLDFIDENKIQYAFVGVPSSDNEISFQIATHLNIPFTIAYEYMFKPEKHVFWNYIDELVANKNCNFAVPLPQAKEDLLNINKNAKVNIVGHLSIDRSQEIKPIDPSIIRKKLIIDTDDEFVFVSGSSQPLEIDKKFVQALLSELDNNPTPGLQLRMGIHPGIKDKDVDAYMAAILQVCEQYSIAKRQFKIIVTTDLHKRLHKPLDKNSPFIVFENVSGTEASSAANRITQAVPGALLNEAALLGKPTYSHDKSAAPYLSKKRFSESITTFFNAKPSTPMTLKALGLDDKSPELLYRVMSPKN